MRSLIEYFDCSVVYKNKGVYRYEISKFSDIYEKIIPFFNKYNIKGVKGLDYLDWCKVAELMKEGKHLTQYGFEQIRKIKAGMNTGRS